jgi:putative mycofactocin binding protein MftB
VSGRTDLSVAAPSVAQLRFALHPSVAVRPEPFGALVYHYGNRKLVFLKSPRIVALVQRLHEFPSVRDALVGLGIPERSHAKYLEALASLQRSDMLIQVESVSTDGHSASTDGHSVENSIVEANHGTAR